MPNVAAMLKQEILRVSRQGNRAEITALRKFTAQHRRDIAALKRVVTELQRQTALLIRRSAKADAAERSADAPPTRRVRFSSKGLRAQRKRLGLSAGAFGRLVGSSAQSVYNWENEKATPRAQQVKAIAALRGIGKREAAARLSATGNSARRAGRKAK